MSLRRRYKIKELIHKRCGKFGYNYRRDGFQKLECKQCEKVWYIQERPNKKIIEQVEKFFKVKVERDEVE